MKAVGGRQEGIVELLLARPETLVNLVEKHKYSALMLATLLGHEAIVARLLAVPRINTAARSARHGNTAMSLAVVNGHTRIVQLLQDFESRQARPSDSAQLPLENPVRPGHLASEDTVDEEVRSECDSEDYQSSEEWSEGDVTTDADASDAEDLDADAEGEDDECIRDEPGESRRDAKRPRDEDGDDLEDAVDDVAPPPPKRRRDEVVEEGP
ncbi:hypothetical protein BKA70DRAFT_1335767 [Coprinopsis sp. MPI-PUGE-AT-0042]|nr:hypothetical protein BKA70DRAFT_1335767 [Coprinopsis sp. MPI-PUGE-AT-0042]